jgi:hypothetical protein
LYVFISLFIYSFLFCWAWRPRRFTLFT